MDERNANLPRLESKVVNYLWHLSSDNDIQNHGDISPSD